MPATHLALKRKLGRIASALGAWLLLAPSVASANEIDWKGYTWSVTNGGMAGVAAGDPTNVSVDGSGYLHLAIRKNGDTWTAAEIFTNTRLGFGTYQWQIDGPIDTFDKNVVLGLFAYGPAAGIGSDGTNEIDIEYSRWGQEAGPNGDWTDYPASGAIVGELSYAFSLSGTLSTSRFIWTQSGIESFLFDGLQAPSSHQELIKSWKYSPSNPEKNIAQQALPLGMNLWCFQIPSDGKNVEIVVRDFQFIPEGTSSGGADGGGSAGTGGGGGLTSIGGLDSGGGTSTGGRSASGGTSGAGISALAGDSSVGGSGGGVTSTSTGGAGSGAPIGGKSYADPSGKTTPARDESGCTVHRGAMRTAGGQLCCLALIALLLGRTQRRKFRTPIGAQRGQRALLRRY